MGRAPQPLANKIPDRCVTAAAHSPAIVVPVQSDRDRARSAQSPENRKNRISFPRPPRIADRLGSRMAACAGRIAPVNVPFKEKRDGQSCGFLAGDVWTRNSRLPHCPEFWDCAWHHREVSKRDRKPGSAPANHCGGNITILTNLCEKTREDAYELLLQHASEHGANAVIGMRYDATEVMQGVTEVLAYGTAVQVERLS